MQLYKGCPRLFYYKKEILDTRYLIFILIINYKDILKPFSLLIQNKFKQNEWNTLEIAVFRHFKIDGLKLKKCHSLIANKNSEQVAIAEPHNRQMKLQQKNFIVYIYILKIDCVTSTGKKPTFQFLLKCGFQWHFSDWNVLNDRHISVAMQWPFSKLSDTIQ